VCLLAGRAERRRQDGDQQAEDGDRDEHFHEGKALAPPLASGTSMCFAKHIALPKKRRMSIRSPENTRAHISVSINP
jgi:hypothetical protein